MERSVGLTEFEPELPSWLHPLERDAMTRQALQRRGVPTFPRWLGWYSLRRDWENAIAIPLTPESQPLTTIAELPDQQVASTLQQGEQFHG